MKVELDTARQAFLKVRKAQIEIEALVARKDVDHGKVVERLKTKFDPAVAEAAQAGIFTGYFKKWADNLCNASPKHYPMVAQPGSLTWEVVALEPGTNLSAGNKAMQNVLTAEKKAIEDARLRAAKHAAEAGKPPTVEDAAPCNDAERAEAVADENAVMRALVQLDHVGVDPVFLNAEVDHVGKALWGMAPAELPKYDYVARNSGWGRWDLVVL